MKLQKYLSRKICCPLPRTHFVFLNLTAHKNSSGEVLPLTVEKFPDHARPSSLRLFCHPPPFPFQSDKLYLLMKFFPHPSLGLLIKPPPSWPTEPLYFLAGLTKLFVQVLLLYLLFLSRRFPSFPLRLTGASCYSYVQNTAFGDSIHSAGRRKGR